jgi:hypothetical protein
MLHIDKEIWAEPQSKPIGKAKTAQILINTFEMCIFSNMRQHSIFSYVPRSVANFQAIHVNNLYWMTWSTCGHLVHTWANLQLWYHDKMKRKQRERELRELREMRNLVYWLTEPIQGLEQSLYSFRHNYTWHTNITT